MDPKNFIKQLTTECSFLALKAKDVPSYLQAHAKILQTILKPRGLGYSLKTNDQLQYILAQNLEDLQETAKTPSIKNIFGQTLQMVLSNKSVRFLSQEESQTPYNHYIVPCIIQNQVYYILHFWFSIESSISQENLIEALEAATHCMGIFLKIQNFPELSQSISQSASHTQLLEELSGEKDLESISWNLVNYAREALQCNRVCLFTINQYTQSIQWAKAKSIHESHFTLQACSGLKKINRRSEQSVIITEMAKSLLRNAFDKTNPTPNNHEAKIAIGIAKREGKIRTNRPYPITHYFARVPMSWAVALPLYSKDSRLCGILLFEGQSIPNNLSINLLRMRILAQASGRAIAEALKWDKHWSLQLTHKWTQFVAKMTPDWQRSMRKKWAIGLFVFLFILCFPLPHRLKGSATITPAIEEPMPAYRFAQLSNRHFYPGDHVHAGDILVILDTEELNAALINAKSELYQAEAAIGRARILNQPLEGSHYQIAAKTALGRIQSIELGLEQSVIRAPFDGILTGPSENHLKTGTIVTPGEILANVIDPKYWKVHLNLREQDMIALENYLDKNLSAEGKLNLLALPQDTFPLIINDKNQITYGVDPFKDNYHYTAVFNLTLSEETGNQLRKGYVGDAYVSIGWRTLAHFFFHDFIAFCKLHW